MEFMFIVVQSDAKISSSQKLTKPAFAPLALIVIVFLGRFASL